MLRAGVPPARGGWCWPQPLPRGSSPIQAQPVAACRQRAAQYLQLLVLQGASRSYPNELQWLAAPGGCSSRGQALWLVLGPCFRRFRTMQRRLPLLHMNCLCGQQRWLLGCVSSFAHTPHMWQGCSQGKKPTTVCMRIVHGLAPVLVWCLVALTHACCHGGTSFGCGGWDLVPDQWFRKRIPTPARTRKLEPYGY